NEILFQLNDLIANQKFQSDEVTQTMLSSFSFLKQLFKILGIALVVGGILIAIFTTRTIVKPDYILKHILVNLSKGIFPPRTLKERSDAIVFRLSSPPWTALPASNIIATATRRANGFLATRDRWPS